jgi:hypothetical protein
MDNNESQNNETQRSNEAEESQNTASDFGSLENSTNPGTVRASASTVAASGQNVEPNEENVQGGDGMEMDMDLDTNAAVNANDLEGLRSDMNLESDAGDRNGGRNAIGNPSSPFLFSNTSGEPTPSHQRQRELGALRQRGSEGVRSGVSRVPQIQGGNNGAAIAAPSSDLNYLMRTSPQSAQRRQRNGNARNGMYGDIYSFSFFSTVYLLLHGLTPFFVDDLGSPLMYPPSTDAAGRSSAQRARRNGTDPLFSQSTQGGNRPHRRGDVTPSQARSIQRLMSRQVVGGLATTPSEGNLTSTADPADVRTVIWGTTVNLQDVMRVFREFLMRFTIADKKRGLYREAREKWEAENENAENPELMPDLSEPEIEPEDNDPFYPKLLNLV